MASWPFGRKILASFFLVSVLLLSTVGVSIYFINSLQSTQSSIQTTELGNLNEANRLIQLLERRVSSLRGYLISRDPMHLREREEAASEFSRIVNSLLTKKGVTESEVSLLREIQTLDADYLKLTARAIKEPSRATWILETLARPRRQELERSLTQLTEQVRARMDLATTGFQNQARNAVSTIMALALGKLALLTLMGVLLARTVREEQAALRQVNEARDTLQGAEQRAAFLAQTGKLLTESLDPKAALPNVAELAVEWLATLCLIELTEGSGILRPAAMAISKNHREELLRSLHRDLPKGIGSLFSATQILQSGRPMLVPQTDDPRLTALGIRTFMAVPLRARGRILGILLLFRTDTDHLFDEATLQFAQELSNQIALAIDNARLLQQAEEGLRMREELLSVVAHDLKNPLTSIRMNAELLLRPKASEGHVEKIGTTIQESAASMDQLIHDLLDLTKIESGRIVLDRRPYDAEELLAACLKMFTPQAEARGVELFKEVRPGECIADCDRNRVIQVLSNLIGNAIKFTGKGGRVRVEAQATGEGIRFSVIDNGPGIPAEQLPHVFDRYWQARRDVTGSAGLGLSIARGVVEAHGGRVWVESALHIGSRFFFTLPEARKQVQRDAA